MEENTGNNNNISRANLSEMDKIFIPEDLDDSVTLEDLSNYKYSLKFWRSVPENFSLVKVNRITQKISHVKGFGLKFIPPIFVKTILVPASIIDGKKSYIDIDCLSSDKIEISVDLTIVMSISNPSKYKRKGSTQLGNLNSIIKRLMRIYVANKKFDELVVEQCQISDFDPNNELSQFERECGIKVNKVIFEKVKLPERLKKLYNDAAEEEQRRKAQIVRLKAEKEKAEADAQVIEIKANAEAKRITKVEEAKTVVWINQMKQFVEYLKQNNIPTNAIAEQLKIKIASEGNSIVSLGENNGIAANIAAGIRTANLNSGTADVDNKVSNSQKLLNDIQALVSFGNITFERYEAVEKMLMQPETKKQLDNCSDFVYNRILEKLSNQVDYEQTYGNTHRR